MNCFQPGSSVHGIFQARIHPSQVTLGAHHHPDTAVRTPVPSDILSGFPPPSDSEISPLLLACLPPQLRPQSSLPLQLISLPGSSSFSCLHYASFSSGSSQPWDQTHISSVSCIGRQVLDPSATWEAVITSVGPNLSTGFRKQLSKALASMS